MSGAQRCPKCNDRVYAAEERKAGNVSYHKRCFTCNSCKKGLDSTSLCEKDGKIYCKSCYGKHFGPKGYGYGGGAGTLSMDTGDTRKPADMRVNMGQFSASSGGSGPRCPRCDKTVYKAEEKISGGQTWHNKCFTCKKCNKRLDSTTVADHEGEIYCKGCHGREFGPKGYGYGGGAGALINTGK